MKKILLAILMASALCLTACGGSETTSSDANNPNLFGSFELKCGSEHCFE